MSISRRIQLRRLSGLSNPRQALRGLEQKLQRKLNLTRRRRGGCDLAKRRVGRTAAIRSLNKRRCVGQAEVGVVEKIEELGAELKARLLFDLRLLHQSPVHDYGMGSGQKVSLQIAERARPRQ